MLITTATFHRKMNIDAWKKKIYGDQEEEGLIKK